MPTHCCLRVTHCCLQRAWRRNPANVTLLPLSMDQNITDCDVASKKSCCAGCICCCKSISCCSCCSCDSGSCCICCICCSWCSCCCCSCCCSNCCCCCSCTCCCGCDRCWCIIIVCSSAISKAEAADALSSPASCVATSKCCFFGRLMVVCTAAWQYDLLLLNESQRLPNESEQRRPFVPFWRQEHVQEFELQTMAHRFPVPAVSSQACSDAT